MNRERYFTKSGIIDDSLEGIMAKIMGKYRFRDDSYKEDGALELVPCEVNEHGLYNVYVGCNKVDTIDWESIPAPTQVWILDITIHEEEEQFSKSCCTSLKEVFHILEGYGDGTVVKINRTENKLIQGTVYNVLGTKEDTGELVYVGTLSLVNLN